MRDTIQALGSTHQAAGASHLDLQEYDQHRHDPLDLDMFQGNLLRGVKTIRLMNILKQGRVGKKGINEPHL